LQATLIRIPPFLWPAVLPPPVSNRLKAIDRETRRSDGARLLKQIKLVEISFVPRPMNPLAEIESVKALQDFDPMHALEGIFDEMQRLTRDLRG
jgi:hypothetical protein